MTWTLGIIGPLLSVIGIISYFTNFLALLERCHFRLRLASWLLITSS